MGVSKPRSVSAGVPGGCQGTWRHRGAHLTLEVGGELHGLAGPWILTDHLLQANVGDLDQVPCGEAALIPRDLVDGACGHRLGFTAARAKPWETCAVFPNKLYSASLWHMLFLLPESPSPSLVA